MLIIIIMIIIIIIIFIIIIVIIIIIIIIITTTSDVWCSWMAVSVTSQAQNCEISHWKSFGLMLIYWSPNLRHVYQISFEF